MRTALCIPIALAFGVLASAADPAAVSPDEAKEMKMLLESLPSQRVLMEARSTVSRLAREGQEGPELERAQETLKNLKQTLPKLRKLLKVGAPILAYPGLLAHGNITYTVVKSSGDPFHPGPSTTEYGYRLYIGVPVEEGIYPYDMEILFDESGKIVKVQGVDWKH